MFTHPTILQLERTWVTTYQKDFGKEFHREKPSKAKTLLNSTIVKNTSFKKTYEIPSSARPGLSCSTGILIIEKCF